MLTAIQKLAFFLADDPLTVDRVIEYLGTVTEDYDGSVLIKPRDPHFIKANVVRQIDRSTLRPSAVPAFVTLTPVKALSLKSLAEKFGKYKEIPAEEKAPAQIIFYLDIPGRPCTIALIGTVKDDQVIEIALRRDPR
jgi:hypothetical protein